MSIQAPTALKKNMTKFAKPKQYMETFQFVQVDILKYKRNPSAFRFNDPLTQKKI